MSGMPFVQYKMIGLCPLLLNNRQMADSDNEFAIRKNAITDDRQYKNSDKGKEELRRIHFFGGLHTHKGKVIIPSAMIYANIKESAKREKKGKDVLAGIVVSADVSYLHFKDEDKTLEELYELDYIDTRLVRIGTAVITRTRPRFDDWWCEAKVYYDDTLFKNEEAVLKYIRRAGRIGIGDYRDLFGKYYIELKKGGKNGR
ncbi:MAG: hypothetical protein ACYTBJ_21455 [Planctomycetota bacterium]